MCVSVLTMGGGFGYLSLRTLQRVVIIAVLFPFANSLGGSISSNEVYDRAGSPYIVSEDIVVERDAKLIIRPGVTVRFDPGVGITVRGILIAQGTEDEKIHLTSNAPLSTPIPKPALRLVDGPTPLQGRLQIFYKHKWRSICTNSKNWTDADRSVACRQLGFTGGSFFEWQDKPNNDTSSLLFESPLCTGLEDDITRCAWHTHSLGGGVCDMHPDMGLTCDEYHAHWIGSSHWRGAYFEYAKHEETLVQENTLFYKVSRSILKHVVIDMAGMGPKRETTAAIHSRGVPPQVSFLNVTNNAHTGINFTLPETFILFRRLSVTNNRGFGIYVNSSTGTVSLEDSSYVADNLADGFKYNFHNKEPDPAGSEIYQDFCTGASNLRQIYPLVTLAKQERSSYVERKCEKQFLHTREDYVFTVHFVYMRTDENDIGSVEVRERNEYGLVLTRFMIRNDTYPSSVVSRTNSIYIKFKAQSRKESFVYMEVVANKFKMYDVKINNSFIANNSGHGMSVDNMRSLVHVHESNLTENFFGSGLNVRWGSGDVNVTKSTISGNYGDGINITYEGGLQNVTWSNIAENKGRGIALWFNESGQDTGIRQETGIAYSNIERNIDIGILVGNFCRKALVNISSNLFFGSVEAALQVESCWWINGTERTTLIVHNTFRRSKRLAIKISPATHMNLTIDWNGFYENEKGTLLVENEDLLELQLLPLTAVISNNIFQSNSGIYVLRLMLSVPGLDQKLFVINNYIKDNSVWEPYESLSSRTKASGVMCIGSTNIAIYRNLIDNRNSLYEITSHAVDQSSSINATYNWLGHKEERVLYERLMDRRDRYNLALIEFHPFLLSDNNMNTPVISQGILSEPPFHNPKDEHLIGGEINGYITLTDGLYTVTRDIYVHHTGTLTIAFGTTLEFVEGVGMMVAGQLRTEGSSQKVRFTLAGTTQREAAITSLDAFLPDNPLNETSVNLTAQNESIKNETSEPEVFVKLVGGRNELQGRLMVYIDETWGSVCSHGWTEDSAAIACQQMGYVLNPEDWLLQPGDLPYQGRDSTILMSNVVCDEFDTDLTKCKSDKYEELENSCSHLDDIGIRCYPRSWAGIRFGMTAKESHMKGVIVENAGLLDYTKRIFAPAIQIDFHHHVIQNVLVQNNLQDGVGVIYSNQYAIANPEARVFKDCIFKSNRRHGLAFRQLGANVTGSDMSFNDGSGFHFNPFISRAQQRELAGWLMLRQQDYIKVPGDISYIELIKDEPRTLATRTLWHTGEKKDITIHVRTAHSNVIGIQILNPITPESTENITIYDFQEITQDEDVNVWSVRSNLSSFPTTSTGYAITIKYTCGRYAMGSAVISLTAVDRRDIAQAGDLFNFRAKWPMVYIDNSKIHKNFIGISTLHYNRYYTEDEDLLLRCSNQTLQVIDSEIVDNDKQAVYVLSPFRVKLDNQNIGEITFMFNDTVISRNGGAVEQYSWDVRESNNLFHWVFDHVLMENNEGSGVSLVLPYVWQYNENFTHTVFVNTSNFISNSNFEFTIDGHFARVNITYSRFEDNKCLQGLMALKGMEKEMFIYENTFEKNQGPYMVEFNIDSQSEILGDVAAYFEYNVVQGNSHVSYSQSKAGQSVYEPASTAISVRGVQKINVTHNLLGSNEMDYELIAGLYTTRIDTVISVEANWWGSANPVVIRERIFDFEDWNSYAIADYQPFLVENKISGSVYSDGGHRRQQDVDFSSLGGRVIKDLRLSYRKEPYIVRSDLTIMPGATLYVEAGATLEFYPSVGILVLGRLEAIGKHYNRITMKPVDLAATTHVRVGRNLRRLPIDVRLCIEGECEYRRDGFLEIYNVTTQQWVPVCDDRFTERNAQIVCQQMGYNKVNVILGQDKRIEMYPNALSRIRSWSEPIQCQGSENRLIDCPIRMNGQIYDHHYECSWNGDFVYISCGELNIQKTNEYWGGISRIHDIETHTHYADTRLTNPSILEWIDIVGAGILHNEKSPAVFSLYETPLIRGVSIIDCAHDGLSLVSAIDQIEMLHNKFSNNLGYGLSLLGLTGETRESAESSFLPLKHVRLPYHTFGMVDICDSAKELMIEERILLFYKYDNRPTDCVKIFSSVFNVKNFGFRFLHLNLYNSTIDPSYPDKVILYEGDIYNETSEVLAEIFATSGNSMKFFKTVGTRLSVWLHVTGASGKLGFVAEVVTLPISNIGVNRNILHNFTYNEYYDNLEGAIFLATAGEVNPWLNVAWSRIERNGFQYYGNLTSSRATVYFDVQNMQDIYFKNNLVRNNTGGLYIEAGSLGAATKLHANITNNLFLETKHWPALYIASKENSAYQHALIAFNDFSWSYSPYHDIITLAQIVSDFSYNYAHSNLGRHILDIYGFEKVRLPVYQTTTHNSLAKNVAVDPTYQATVVAGSAGQQYVDNVFYNWDNAYEMVAVNETVITSHEPPSYRDGIYRRCNMSAECDENYLRMNLNYEKSLTEQILESDVWRTPINARHNWWGFNTSVAVSGRIHDKQDDFSLLTVDYTEWRLDNYSLLFGCEPGYTLVGDSCYLYVGAPVNYQEAKEFCRRDNASLPFLQKWYGNVQLWLKKQQPEYEREYDMIWVQHYDIVYGCGAFVNRRVQSVDCSLNLPFLCESDARDAIDPTAWVSDTLVIAAVASTLGCFILIIACLSCWVCKSRHRRQERLMRRNSIRASIRSSRSAMSTASGGFSELGHRRKILNETNRPAPVPVKGNGNTGGGHANGRLSPSEDSIAKSNFDSSVEEEAISYGDHRSPSVFGDDIDTRFATNPGLENANINAAIHPTFDLTYENQGFRDTSTVPSSFTSRDVSQNIWNGSNNLLEETSTLSSFQNASLGDSQEDMPVEVFGPNAVLELKDEPRVPLETDIHRAATLPRDQAAPSRFVSADVLTPRQLNPEDRSQNNFDQGLSQSQPLETAM